MNEPIIVGRVLRSSTTSFTVGCRQLISEQDQRVPEFGALVRAEGKDGDIVYGLIFNVTIEDDAFVRQLVAAGVESAEIIEDQRQKRQVPIVVDVLVVGGGQGLAVYHRLPAQPPSTLDQIYLCNAAEIVRFTERHDWLRTVLGAVEVPADQLLIAALRAAAQARPPDQAGAVPRCRRPRAGEAAGAGFGAAGWDSEADARALKADVLRESRSDVFAVVHVPRITQYATTIPRRELMTSLKNTIVLITGASSGIGAASARAFAAEGAHLILAARRGERIRAAAEQLRAEFGIETLPLTLDVRDQAAVARVLGSLPERWAAVDILLNNAGLSRGLDKLHEGLISDWDEMIDTNVKGLLYVTRAVLPGMVARGRGHVINTGSIAGHEPYPGGNVYCASKAAVAMLNKTLRLDLLGTGIRVTERGARAWSRPSSASCAFTATNSARSNRIRASSPSTAADIADAILWAAHASRACQCRKHRPVPDGAGVRDDGAPDVMRADVMRERDA